MAGAIAPILLTLILVAVAPAGVLARAAPIPAAEALWTAWPAARFVSTPAPCLGPERLAEAIRRLAARHPGRLRVEEVGRSVQGRPIHLLTLGRGPRRVLLWSQMHGDEPSATPALLDVAHYLLESGNEETREILDGLTLLMAPMLNPDGAHRHARRNAQAIDVNRDALQLTTPEGRLLKALRDRFEPELGFNLHDQDRRTTVGRSGRLATIALLAVAGDEAGTLTPGRARAKRVCALIARTLQPFVPGGIARYDEDWNSRAFGDNLTRWGTPVVLIESGGLPPRKTYEDLTRLNFVALLTALSGLARDDLAGEDWRVYEELERNEDDLWVDVLVAGGELWQPGAGEPYRADVTFDRLDPDPVRASCESPAEPGPSRVREIGDASLVGAAQRVEAEGCLVMPGLAVSVRGLAARDWLDADALARLGVARVRWHVDPDDHAEAATTARRLMGPRRPMVELAALEQAPHLLELDGPLRPPAGSLRLDAVLDALSGGRWRRRARGRPLGELLGPLTGAVEVDTEGPPLAPDRPASFLLLRPERKGSRVPSELALDRVFLDGREPEPGR